MIAIRNECLSLCRCHLSEVIQRHGEASLIETQFSQHKSALVLNVLGFLLDCIVLLHLTQYSEFSLSLSLSSSHALSLSLHPGIDILFAP